MKPPGPVITPAAERAIHKALDTLFDRVKARVLGPQSVSKHVAIDYNHMLSLPGIFESAAREEGYIPDMKTLKQLLNIAGGYIDATRSQTKARVVKEVTAFLQDAYAAGVKTDLATVLGGKLAEVFDQTKNSLRRIIDTECNQVKNVGVLEGITRINAAQGVENPMVFWVSVNDESRCDECTRLHCMPDGITPRVWLLSEIGHAYHKRGDGTPKIGGLHPNCRCTLAGLSTGYGFDSDGRVMYKNRYYNEYESQHSTK